MGIDAGSTFFSNMLITGSHENAVIALAGGQVDVAANWWNAPGRLEPHAACSTRAC